MRQIEEEKSCYNCEVVFTVISEVEGVSYCPFCGSEVETQDEDSDDQVRWIRLQYEFSMYVHYIWREYNDIFLE